jgi:hypothetical protein
MIKIKKTRIDDIMAFAPLVRQADVVEGLKGSGDQMSVEDHIFKSVTWSKEAFTVFEGDTPIAMFGIGRTWPEEAGVPWFVCSERISRYKKRTVKYAKRYLAKVFREGCTFLRNAVDPDNHAAIAFIKHLGFTFTGETMRTEAGYDFDVFERRREDV